MRNRIARALLILLACGMSAAAPAAEHAVAPLPPIESFFQAESFSGGLLSPDARLVAARVARPGKRDGLAVFDLVGGGSTMVAGFNDTDIGTFRWVNNERLVFTASDKDLGAGQKAKGPGLYAVNRDGGNFRQLVSRHRVAERNTLESSVALLPQAGAQNSASVYVTKPNYESRSFDLLRLDTLTGYGTRVEGPEGTFGWLLDQNGEPRIAMSHEKKINAIHYLDPASGKWRKLAETNAFTGGGVFELEGFAPDGTLYVRASQGRDKTALYRFDLATGKVADAPLVDVKDYDFSGSLVISNQRLLGVHVLTDARSTQWFDPAMKKVQERIDALLPDTNNLISVGAHAQTPWVLVLSYSDVQPRMYTLFNTETGAVKKLGGTHSAIKPAQMGTQQALRYKARDGLEIPFLLTLPPGKAGKNLPLVVLVHGGPYVRGSEWGWNPDTQFLASRGYAVLEPEYRGSTGFGNAHYRAGWKQWGLKMQDDIADGAKWAIAQGIADPKRICIAGASYGGYATLMGLVNDPGLYQCGIEWVGVTDLTLLHDGHWTGRSDMGDDYRDFGMPELVGDVDKDAERFTATSPLKQAARIKQPLLMAYGGADVRVPVYHGRKFHDAVKAHNPNVEMVVYEEEGHGWALPKNRIDFWSRVEKFLDRNIGTAK